MCGAAAAVDVNVVRVYVCGGVGLGSVGLGVGRVGVVCIGVVGLGAGPAVGD